EVPLLGGEVVVQQRLRDPGLLGDPGHRQLVVREAREQVRAELQQLPPALVDAEARVRGAGHRRASLSPIVQLPVDRWSTRWYGRCRPMVNNMQEKTMLEQRIAELEERTSAIEEWLWTVKSPPAPVAPPRPTASAAAPPLAASPSPASRR